MVGIWANIRRIVASACQRFDRMEAQVVERLLYAAGSKGDRVSSTAVAASSTEEGEMMDSSEAREEHVQEVEELRRQLAYDIHDGLAQKLAGAVYRFEAFREAVSQDSVLAWSNFDTGLALLRQAVEETRRMINELRTPALEELGLAAAVEQLAHGAPGQEKPAVGYQYNLQGYALPATVERAAYRIVQEALTNARRHSQSENVRLELFQDGKGLRISIEDWGVGFDPAKVESNSVGLAGIRERARLLGGHATIDSAPGKGTRIVVEIPIPSTSSLEDMDV
jgi:signal transduction histidine kinase